MRKAYSYVRFSSPEQMKGDSFRRQREKAQKWADANNCVIDETIADLGVSAFRGKNSIEGSLAKFLTLVQAGKVEQGSVLLVESLDRFSREKVLDVLPRFLDVIRAGVSIVTLIDGQEYSAERLGKDWTPLLISLAVMARAHDESLTKSIRLSDLWTEKRTRAAAERKVATARVPYWLRVEEDNGRRKIVEVPERAGIVKRIFAETAAGFGRRSVCRRLNAEGIQAFSSKGGWQPSYIAKVLRSRTVLGELQPMTIVQGKRVPAGPAVENYYPATVDESLFYRANAALDARRTGAGGRRGKAVPNLLVGIARCAACGGRMLTLNKGEPPKGSRYYQCSVQARNAGCDNSRMWRVDKVEPLLLASLDLAGLDGILQDPDDVDPAAAVAPIEAAIADRELKRSRLLQMVEDGDEKAVARSQTLRAEVASLTQALAKARDAERAARHVPDLPKRLHMVAELGRQLESADDSKRELLRRQVSQELRAGFAEVLFARDAVVLVIRMGGPYRREGPLPPPWSDGRPMREWTVKRFLIDERPPDEPEPDRVGEVPGWLLRKARGQA